MTRLICPHCRRPVYLDGQAAPSSTPGPATEAEARLKQAAVYLAYHSRPEDFTAGPYNAWEAARRVILADDPPYPCVSRDDAG